MGARIDATTVTTTGKTIFVVFDTGCFTTPMTIFLSWSVVSQRMIGGCINGTKDICEYAATETAPSKCGANFELT